MLNRILTLIIAFILCFLFSGCSQYLSGEAVPTENAPITSETDISGSGLGGGAVLQEF